MKKKGESRELLRPLVRKYVEANLAPERGKRWMPVMSAISGFFVAPYLAVETALEDRRVGKENGKKYGFWELGGICFGTLWMFWNLSWHGLVNTKESDEEWQEYIEEQVEYATAHIRQGWYIILDEALRQSNDTVLVVDRETMLPVSSASLSRGEAVKETLGCNNYGIGWNEFVDILKEVRKSLPEDQILPIDIMEQCQKMKILIKVD